MTMATQGGAVGGVEPGHGSGNGSGQEKADEHKIPHIVRACLRAWMLNGVGLNGMGQRTVAATTRENGTHPNIPDGARPYVVCCAPRVVLFGYATDDDRQASPPCLHRVRMLVYWDAATRGVHGAAAHGPTDGCRVTPPAPSQTIDTAIEAWIACTAQAVERFEAGPWAA